MKLRPTDEAPDSNGCTEGWLKPGVEEEVLRLGVVRGVGEFKFWIPGVCGREKQMGNFAPSLSLKRASLFPTELG